MSVLHVPVNSLVSSACSRSAAYTPEAHTPLYDGTLVNSERSSTHAFSFSGKFEQANCGLYLMSGAVQDAEAITLASLVQPVAICAVQSVTMVRKTLNISFAAAEASTAPIRWAALVGKSGSDLIVMVFDAAELDVSVLEGVATVKDVHITMETHLEAP